LGSPRPWFALLPVKLVCPSTRSAVELGAGLLVKCSTRWLPVSATHSSVGASSSPWGALKPALSTPPPWSGLLAVKVAWPQTALAEATLSGLPKRSTRWLPVSATARRPKGSKLRAVGPFRLAAPSPPWLAPVLKKLPPWPSTPAAAVPVAASWAAL